MTKYLKRVADEVLAFRLRSSGAVLITGPKWCGKSTTALQAAKSSILFRDGPSQAQNIALARALPDEVLRGRVPRLLDEWQLVPFMWDENIDAGAASLLKLAAKIDGTKMKRPSFLAVITGTEFAYRRDDGVYVIPLGCLRP